MFSIQSKYNSIVLDFLGYQFVLQKSIKGGFVMEMKVKNHYYDQSINHQDTGNKFYCLELSQYQPIIVVSFDYQ